MENFDQTKFRGDVFEVLAKLSGTAKENIKLTDKLGDDLTLDSLKRMEALSRIADQYDLDPDLEKVMEIETVQDVLTLMEQHMSGDK